MPLSPPSTHKDGILIMDSRHALGAPQRHQGLLNVWNRLYKIGSFYLDLSLKRGPNGAFLVGQVIGAAQKPPALRVTLHAPSYSRSSFITERGNFRIQLPDKGDLELELTLDSETFWVRGLDV
ncbi:hypothetical protein A3962_09955 [Meiothermus taiwanensis]|nr:hypothetical protein A3962_09955 [Meiothermus taiwanensis]